MRKGYFLYSPANLPANVSIAIYDAHSHAKVDTWTNELGGIAGDVYKGRVYYAVMTIDTEKFGWFFAGHSFDRGYNFFGKHSAVDYGITL